jgi:cytochrome c-type biogenesis protein CcmE
MTPQRKQRLALALGGLVLSGAATALLLNSLGDNLHYYRTPTEVRAPGFALEDSFRTGGLVVTGSVQHAQDSMLARFCVSDGTHQVPVRYRGILPDLFREGQGIIATGRWQEGEFIAEVVLAKHDEQYMPREVAESLKHSGKSVGGQEHPANRPIPRTAECHEVTL